jgi:hypothetical protein
MGDAGLFIVGVMVTLMVGAAFATLVWAEIQDGHTQRASERGEPHDLSETDGRRSAVAVRSGEGG